MDSQSYETITILDYSLGEPNLSFEATSNDVYIFHALLIDPPLQVTHDASRRSLEVIPLIPPLQYHLDAVSYTYDISFVSPLG